MGENQKMIFLYIKRFHSLEAPTSQFSSYNWKEDMTPYLQALQDTRYIKYAEQNRNARNNRITV
jgi:hypothetical protein